MDYPNVFYFSREDLRLIPFYNHSITLLLVNYGIPDQRIPYQEDYSLSINPF